MLKEVANVDCSYNLTPEELYAKVAVSDALIVRSATKVRLLPKLLRNGRDEQ
jgi:D-3-phosphoglycerate dehydrogenase